MAMRRLWARIVREDFGAKNPNSGAIKIDCANSGVEMASDQMELNIVRAGIATLAAAFSGADRVGGATYDEPLGIPSSKAIATAIRTRHIVADECGVIDTVDPLGGSYFIEKLTSEMEEEALVYIKKIDDMGGMIAAIDHGYPQREIADAAYRYQKQIESKEKIVVGMNDFVIEEKPMGELLKIPDELYHKQVARIAKVKKMRDSGAVKKALDALNEACEKGTNVMPKLLDCARAYATENEMMSVMKSVFGEYRDPAVF